MTEIAQQPEVGGQPQEFSQGDHQAFVEKRSNSLVRRAGKILGSGLIGAGAAFALVGIGDFVTGGEVSRTLMQVNPSNAPEIVAWVARHTAQMPELIKLAGGTSMISTGAAILDRLPK